MVDFLFVIIEHFPLALTVAVWLNGNGVVTCDQRSCFTLGSVSTWMGDRIGVQLPVTKIYLGLTNHPDQLSLAIHPWVGRMSTDDGLLVTTREETASSA